MSAQLTHSTHESTGKELLRGGLVFVGVIFIGSLALLLLIWIATAFGLDADFAKWGRALTLVGTVLALAAVIIGAWRDWRYVLVESVAADIDYKYATADAIRNASERAQVVNVNSGTGTQINKNKPIQYRVNGNNVGQLNVAQSAQIDARTIHIEGADIKWFADQLAAGIPHSRSKWLGMELPYSRIPVTRPVHTALIDAIAEAGGIVGRGERASGTLIERAPTQIVKMIEATYPDAGKEGITLELSEKPS